MSRRFRFVLLWLMLLALPLQGYAAAVALHCGQQPQGAVHPSGKSSDAPVASAQAPACHGAATPHHSGTVSKAKFKCSACAACCFGVALAPPALTFESMPPVALRVAFIPVSVLGFFTDGPDRPPRLSTR